MLDEVGVRFWKDHVDGAQPYFDVPTSSLLNGRLTPPGYTVFPVLNLAVAGFGWRRYWTGSLSHGHALYVSNVFVKDAAHETS